MRQGSQRDAILYSVGANAAHGLRRTNADKRRAVEVLLRDDEWAAWSNGQIARACGVSDEFVRQARPIFQPLGDTPRLVTRGGTTYPMNTAAIGRVTTVEPAQAPGWNEAGEPIVRRDDPAQVAAFFGKPAGQAAASPAPVRVPVPTSEGKGRPPPPAPLGLARGSLSPTPFAIWMASELRTLPPIPAGGAYARKASSVVDALSHAASTGSGRVYALHTPFPPPDAP